MTDDIFSVNQDRQEISNRLLKENFMLAFKECREKIIGRFTCSEKLLSLISDDCRLLFDDKAIAIGKNDVKEYLNGTEFNDKHFLKFEAAIQLNIFGDNVDFPFGEPSLSITDYNYKQVAQCFVNTKDDYVSEIIFKTEDLAHNSVYFVPDDCNPDTLISSGMAVNILYRLFNGDKSVLPFIFETSDGETEIVDLNRQMIVRKGSMACAKYLESMADRYPEGTGNDAQIFKTYELLAARSHEGRGFFIWPKITNVGKFGTILIRKISRS